MKPGYDIFRQLDDGSPMWVAHVATRTQAQLQVASLRLSAPARYFIRDAETGELLNDFEPGAVGKDNPAE